MMNLRILMTVTTTGMLVVIVIVAGGDGNKLRVTLHCTTTSDRIGWTPHCAILVKVTAALRSLFRYLQELIIAGSINNR